MSTPSYNFVLDARNEMGLGHLRRCVSIAEALLIQQPCALIRLVAVGASRPLPIAIDPDLTSCFLPTDEVFKDPSCLLKKGFSSNVVFIIDHYVLNSDKWLGRLRLSYPTAPVFSFDDSELGRTWPVLGLFRLGIGAKKDDLEDGATEFSAIGSEFLPIRSDLKCVFDNSDQRVGDETRPRVIVILGGSDPEKYTERVVEALAKIVTSVDFDVVFGPGADPMRAKAIVPDEHFTFHYAPANFLDLMCSASLAVCGGGNTCYEFLHIGVPVAILALAENQYATCEALHAQGFGHFLGYAEKLSDQDLFARIETFISKSSEYRAMAEKGRSLIDGKGAERLATNITKSVTSYFTDLFPQEEVACEYDESADYCEEYEKVRWGSEASMINRLEFVCSKITWSRVDSWLDIGSGTGEFLRIVEPQASIKKFTGIDLSEKLIEFSRKKKFRTQQVDFLCQSFMSKLENASYSLVTAVGVLHKCGFSLENSIARIGELVAEDGQVVMTTKNADWYRFDEPGFLPFSGHHWFTPRRIQYACRWAGLEIVGLACFDSATKTISEDLRSQHSLLVLCRKMTDYSFVNQSSQ